MVAIANLMEPSPMAKRTLVPAMSISGPLLPCWRDLASRKTLGSLWIEVFHSLELRNLDNYLPMRPHHSDAYHGSVGGCAESFSAPNLADPTA